MDNSFLSIRIPSFLLVFMSGLLPAAHGAGGPGFALSFDSASYVSVPHNAALNAYPLTVTAWIHTFQSNGRPGLVNKFQNGVLNAWQIYLDKGVLRANYMAGNSAYVGD